MVNMLVVMVKIVCRCQNRVFVDRILVNRVFVDRILVNRVFVFLWFVEDVVTHLALIVIARQVTHHSPVRILFYS